MGSSKLLPYKGFYPADRTVEIAQQFYSSYGENISFTSDEVTDTTSNYDRAHKVPRTNASFANVNTQNGSYWGYNENGTAFGESQNGIMYLHNFNSSSKFSTYSLETSEVIASGELQGINGGGVHKVAQSCDGIHIYLSSGNFSAGTFTLYKVT